jgi:hypothetical protein
MLLEGLAIVAISLMKQVRRGKCSASLSVLLCREAGDFVESERRQNDTVRGAALIHIYS